ncbi:hypothetical protein LIER_42689 [Lithospermum erythrorhizon]|uniref:Uncharacterized protein n=1 Tax=Lithospermum erythrorhizon TaxID=34254 RepID=A0AAV3NRD4_LITER
MGRCTLGFGLTDSPIAFPLANDESPLNPSLYDLCVYERECPYVMTTNLVVRQEPLATQSSSSSSDDSDSTSASSPIPQVTITDKVASKITQGNDDVMAPVPIKGTSSFQICTFNLIQIECLNPLGITLTTLNFVLALGRVKWRHPSMGGMPILQFAEPLAQVPLPQTIEPANPVAQANDIEVARAEAAYQGMMASLPTFVKNSTPLDLTEDQLDSLTRYFAIPLEKVDTCLAILREQLYLPHIKENSTDRDLTFGYTSVYVEAFSYGIRLPFSPFVNNLLTTINRVPGQLLPIGSWLNVTLFYVACRMCGIEPIVSLFFCLILHFPQIFSNQIFCSSQEKHLRWDLS